MAVKLTCDICKKDVKSLDKIGKITEAYQVPGRIEHICSACARKLDQKLMTFRDHYSKLMAEDARQWLLELENKSRPSAIITSL